MAGAVAAAAVGAAREAVADGAPASALDKPAFTASPAELLALAKAAPAADGDAATTVLRDERDTAFDAQGRAVERHHRVYVVRKVDADADDPDDDESRELGIAWTASYQDRPLLRARVIGSDGAVVALDPATAVAPPWSDDHRDRRYLSAPLPGYQAGAVVEVEIVVRDREPPPGGAGWVRHVRWGPHRIESYSAPVGRPLHRVERALPASMHARHEVADGRERWIYEMPPAATARSADLDASPAELDVPGDVVVDPYIGVSTAASWRAVARAYRALIDRRIAEGPVVLPASLPHAATRAAVDQIAGWIRSRPRDEKHEVVGTLASPSSPAVTLTRGTLGGADRATLLVALLRQAGVRAQLVLVGAVGGGSDVDPDLPGLAQFSAALVRAQLASGDVWIAPDEPTTPPGRPPVRDQGRRGLVIADDTTGLITLPQARSEDNAIREVRSFTPPEVGRAALTVVSRATGAFDVQQRLFARYRATARRPPDSYGGTETSVTSSGVDDVETPYTTTHEVAGSRWVDSEWDELAIELPIGELIGELPKHLRERAKTPRVHDVAWNIPHVHEIENRIELPPGYAPPPAADRVVNAGPATLRIQQRVDGRFLIITMRFDTGKPRWSAAELTAMQDALPGIVDPPFKLSIERTARALEGAGKLREAVAENARLIALHPGEALHHQHLALSLIAAGDGEGARREARAAVALEPGNSGPLITLAWVLRHDRLGRDARYDWDRAGALEAARKARVLDPHDAGAAIDVALALQRSAAGELFGPGVDMRAVVEAWVEAHAIEVNETTTLGLAEALLWSGRPLAAETMARAVTVPSARRDSCILAAIAEAQGATAALAEAARLRTGDELVRQLTRVMWWEMYLRHYDLARALFAGNHDGKLSPFWAAALARLAPRHPVARPPGDPRGAIDELFEALNDPARKTSVFGDVKLEADLRRWFTRAFAEVDESPPIHGLLADALASASIQLDGDRGVWRARVTGLWQPTAIYLALVGNAVRVIGTGGDNADGVGRHVLRLDLADAGAAATARRLLDWQREDLETDKERTAVLFRRVWGPGHAPTPAAITSAGAVLSVWSDEDLTLARAAQCTPLPPDAQAGCHETLGYAHARHRQWAEAEAEFAAAQALDPGARAAFLWTEALVLAWAGRFDEADRAVDSVLAGHPDDMSALEARQQVAAMRGDRAEAARRAEVLTRLPGVTPRALNEIAWHRLAEDDDLGDALALARRAVDGARYAYGYRNTLAALEAATGDLGAAVRDNWVALARSGSSEPLPGDWYVAARIDEQIGQIDDAIAIYRRLVGSNADPLSAAGLAARRLAALQHAP